MSRIWPILMVFLFAPACGENQDPYTLIIWGRAAAMHTSAPYSYRYLYLGNNGVGDQGEERLANDPPCDAVCDYETAWRFPDLCVDPCAYLGTVLLDNPDDSGLYGTCSADPTSPEKLYVQVTRGGDTHTLMSFNFSIERMATNVPVAADISFRTTLTAMPEVYTTDIADGFSQCVGTSTPLDEKRTGEVYSGQVHVACHDLRTAANDPSNALDAFISIHIKDCVTTTMAAANAEP